MKERKRKKKVEDERRKEEGREKGGREGEEPWNLRYRRRLGREA